MRIDEILSELVPGGAYQGATIGQAMKAAALKGLGLGNTADQFAQKHNIGAYSGSNARELIKALGDVEGKPITAPMDFEIKPGQRVKIKKVDNTGLTFTDPNTGLDQILGVGALQQIVQNKQALRSVAAQAAAKPNQPTSV